MQINQNIPLATFSLESGTVAMENGALAYFSHTTN